MLRFYVNVFGQPFSCTWEQASNALQTLPAMIFEPDGSWVWAGGANDTRWQVDGHLFDFDGRLHRVELHGQCPIDQFDQLLVCLGWPDTKLTFEQVQEGTIQDEEDFRRIASAHRQ